MSDCCNVDRPGESCATVLTEERAATDSRCADCETEGRPVDKAKNEQQETLTQVKEPDLRVHAV